MGLSTKTANRRGGPAMYGAGYKDSVPARPPKPPSWRDFVDKDFTRSIEVTDINKAVPPRGLGPPGEAGNLPLSSNTYPLANGHNSASRNRRKAKIHRTRSQMNIDHQDLPDVDLTRSLADTHPQEVGLGDKTHGLEADNAERCQRWLADIEACEPLDEVAISSSGDGVEVEVPEERWSDFPPSSVRNPRTPTSPSVFKTIAEEGLDKELVEPALKQTDL